MYIKRSVTQKVKDLFTKDIKIAERYMAEVNKAKSGEWGGKEVSILFGKRGVMERLYGSGKDLFKINMGAVRIAYKDLKTNRILNALVSKSNKEQKASKEYIRIMKLAKQCLKELKQTMESLQECCKELKTNKDFATILDEVQKADEIMEKGASMVGVGVMSNLYITLYFLPISILVPEVSLIIMSVMSVIGMVAVVGGGGMYSGYSKLRSINDKHGDEIVKKLNLLLGLQKKARDLRKNIERYNKTAKIPKDYDAGYDIKSLANFFETCKIYSEKFSDGVSKDPKTKETPLLKAQKEFATLIAELGDEKHYNISKVEEQVDRKQKEVADLVEEAQAANATVQQVAQRVERVDANGNLTP